MTTRGKPIFVVFTTDTCPYCTKFMKDIYPELKRKLDTLDIVSFYHIEKTRKGFDYNLYPEDINRFAPLVPSLLMFNQSSWINRDRLEGESYNMKIDDKGAITRVTDPKPMTVDAIISWVKSMAKKPSLTAELMRHHSTRAAKRPTTELAELF